MTSDLRPRIKVLPNDLVVNREISFEAVLTGESSGGEKRYGWVFRDQSGEPLGTDTGKTVTRTFPDVGEYGVELTVVGPDGDVYTREGTYYVEKQGNEDPEVRIMMIPPVATVGQEITFDGRKSEDPDGTITSYEWEFKKGLDRPRETVGTGTGETVRQSFSEPGKYLAQLTLTDDSRDLAFNQRIVKVRDE